MTMRDLLVAMAERSASDLHITSGVPPTLRVHGHLVALEYPALTPDQTKALAYSLITTEQREASRPLRAKHRRLAHVADRRRRD